MKKFPWKKERTRKSIFSSRWETQIKCFAGILNVLQNVWNNKPATIPVCRHPWGGGGHWRRLASLSVSTRLGRRQVAQSLVVQLITWSRCFNPKAWGCFPFFIPTVHLSWMPISGQPACRASDHHADTKVRDNQPRANSITIVANVMNDEKRVPKTYIIGKFDLVTFVRR